MQPQNTLTSRHVTWRSTPLRTAYLLKNCVYMYSRPELQNCKRTDETAAASTTADRQPMHHFQWGQANRLLNMVPQFSTSLYFDMWWEVLTFRKFLRNVSEPPDYIAWHPLHNHRCENLSSNSWSEFSRQHARQLDAYTRTMGQCPALPLGSGYQTTLRHVAENSKPSFFFS
jgi:hypothetical protein